MCVCLGAQNGQNNNVKTSESDILEEVEAEGRPTFNFFFILFKDHDSTSQIDSCRRASLILTFTIF